MPDLAAEGVSYRQLDYWCRQGYLRVPGNGTGNRRQWSATELQVAERMAKLVKVGFTVPAAAEIARQTVNADAAMITLTPGVHLVFGARPSIEEVRTDG